MKTVLEAQAERLTYSELKSVEDGTEGARSIMRKVQRERNYRAW